MSTDYAAIDAMIAAKYPTLEPAQARSLGTYIGKGWAFVDIGRADEVNIVRGEGLAAERGYLRVDGVFRPA